MPRPCEVLHPNPPETAGECRLCWLYENDPRYRAHWGGGVLPARRSKACCYKGSDLRDNHGKAITRHCADAPG